MFTADGEVVCSLDSGAGITSGGGFSSQFAQPGYQSTMVQLYTQAGVVFPDGRRYNATGRVIPDVALMGHNYQIVSQGTVSHTDGTSCSTPAFAAIIAAVNSVRLAQGKPALGFLNPLLYKLGSAQYVNGQFPPESAPFTDVVKGDNKCAESFCCDQGFAAAPGFDAATG